MFTSKRIEEKSSPFLKEHPSTNPKLRVFFGPEINTSSQKNPIFLKRFFIWLIVLIIVLFYLFWGIINLFAPPKIIIYSPPENYITDQKVITLQGTTNTSNAIIKINGQVVSLDNENIFEEKISLLNGVNIIKISSRKKFGWERVIFRNVIVH